MQRIYDHIDANQNDLVSKLAQVVAIPSVSGDVAHRKDVVEMGNWLEKELKRLGATYVFEFI
jgi:Cys-Gly metallodipeptidase DUG1